MTPAAYCAALARIGLTVASKATAEILGITVRSSQRYASGEQAVSEQIETRIKLIEALGLDEARAVITKEKRK